jgi:tetratricopeptide (TPR) repeat protein
LAERAVAAYRAQGEPDYGYPRAFHAELLLRLGREDEAMAELTALRPLLSEDPDAVSYISEALEAGGQAEIAEQWLTEALVTAPQRMEALEAQGGRPAYEDAVAVVFRLAQCRHRLRRDLGLPHDAHDQLADLMQDAINDVLRAIIEQDYAETALLFWPQPEFGRVLLRWPALAEEYGHTWDEYRTTVQRSLVQWSESGSPRSALLAGTADGLASYADDNGGDPTDPQVRQDYVEYLEEHLQEIAWPPGRNQECWCGSGLKYKKCCLPRARN